MGSPVKEHPANDITADSVALLLKKIQMAIKGRHNCSGQAVYWWPGTQRHEGMHKQL